MSKQNKAQKIEVPPGLKVLCILSFLGFAASMAIDSGNYLSYTSIEEIKIAPDQTAWEKLEPHLEMLAQRGVDVSKTGQLQIAKMYLFRCIIDIISLLGVSMMFIRLKLGFVIYVIGQVSYLAVPLAMFGAGGISIVGIGSMVITFVYILLFSTQKKHLIR